MAQKETPWFYHPDLSIDRLSAEEARHATSALRLQAARPVVLTTGKGQTAHAVVAEVKKGEVRLQIGQIESQPAPDSLKSLVVGRLHHAERLEWVIEKGQELGLSRLVVAEMDRCGKGSQNLDRWQRIAISALKQSHQAWLCQVVRASSLEAALNGLEGPGVFGFIDEAGQTPLLVSHKFAPYAVIGPEADFSNSEVALMKERGLQPVSLGPTRLRTETAAVAAAVLLLLA